MTQYHEHVNGHEFIRTVGGQQYTANQSFLRMSTDDHIDVVLQGDGSKTVLDLIKEAANSISQVQVPADPGPEWDELLKIPPAGIDITINLGTGAQYQVPKV